MSGDAGTATVTASPAGGRELGARARQTLERLLDAGVSVFRRVGYHQARVDDVVRAANTSHGTFYSYFANKEDLFRALARDVVRDITEAACSLGPVEPGREGFETIRRWVDDLSAVYDANEPVIRVWTEAETRSSELGRMGAEMLAQVSAALEARIAGDVGVGPRIAALALVAMIDRANYHVRTGELPVAGEVMVDTLAAVAYSSLFGPPDPGWLEAGSG